MMKYVKTYIYIYNQTDNQPQEYDTYTNNHQSTKPNEQPTTTIRNTTLTNINLQNQKNNQPQQ
jgi:hypothetical protein